MMSVMVQYKVKPERAEENKAFIRAVFEELAVANPAGLHYSVFTAPDGISFTHVATYDGEGPGPLSQLNAFKAFTKDVKGRCDEMPVATQLVRIESHG